MKKNFLVTRPVLQSEKVSELLCKEGFEVIIEPISDVKYLKCDEKEVKNLKKGEIQAILITSFNASETFLNFNLDKNVPIYAVGEKSIEKILENGYKNVIFPEKSNVSELERLFLQQNCDQAGQILYFCGNYLTKDLKLSFKERGFDVQKIQSYIVKYHDEFSANFLDLIKIKKIDNILCYSKNNARCFAKLVEKHNLQDYFSKVNLIAISEEVAGEAGKLGFARIRLFSDYKFLTKL